MWDWIEEFRHRVADDFAPRTREEFVAHCLARAAGSERSWAIRRDGELCGLVTYEAANPVTGTTHALFRKDYWGHETTVEGLRQVYEALFASGVRKLMGPVFRDNRAIIAVGMMMGAKREGILRQQTMRGGKPVDVVVLGLVAEDFDKWRSARTV